MYYYLHSQVSSSLHIGLAPPFSFGRSCPRKYHYHKYGSSHFTQHGSRSALCWHHRASNVFAPLTFTFLFVYDIQFLRFIKEALQTKKSARKGWGLCFKTLRAPSMIYKYPFYLIIFATVKNKYCSVSIFSSSDKVTPISRMLSILIRILSKSSSL